MPDKTRGERIGRAAEQAFRAQEFWDGAWPAIGLAAVAEARRIDTCWTCESQSQEMESFTDGEMMVVPVEYCHTHEMPCFMINHCGCNRHEPKGE